MLMLLAFSMAQAQTDIFSDPRGISYPFQVPAGTIFSVFVDNLFVL